MPYSTHLLLSFEFDDYQCEDIPPFGETILVIFDHSKWFENGLKNGLTLQILRWYKWLRFKDIVQGFGKLKKIVEKSGMEQNGMVWRIEKSEKIEWVEWCKQTYQNN